MELQSLEDSRYLAGLLQQHIPEGGLLLLCGQLGSGKTTLVQLLGAQLGSSAHISSPSYTLIHEYPSAEGLLVHIDAYRLEQASALRELGLDDYLERARLVAVEWGEALLEHYPDAFVLQLQRLSDPSPTSSASGSYGTSYSGVSDVDSLEHSITARRQASLRQGQQLLIP